MEEISFDRYSCCCQQENSLQDITYMPYGELLVDESTVDLDFRFSAKETDRETGLSYFGARYYDPTVAVWLGTDPLWEVYAGMNPYNYCAGNPVGLMDVDGRRFTEAAEKMAQKMEAYADNGIEIRQKELAKEENCNSLEQTTLRPTVFGVTCMSKPQVGICFLCNHSAARGSLQKSALN